ncbi:hypothetical protein CK203_041501 [Vitis vinifera]|uniref:Uncharacterized protein n=1 Tax=Vitis vinifera TaxID=29760 RepID=A0A438HNH3_VITVI|nr:hypothetical protein CK203_041501 [Vitis vinifera]
MLVIRMYCGADIFMEVVRMPMLCKRRLLFLEAVRIYKVASYVFYRKVRMRVTRMTMRAMCHCNIRATCHCQMRAMCSQRAGVTVPPCVFVGWGFLVRVESRIFEWVFGFNLGLKKYLQRRKLLHLPRPAMSVRSDRQTGCEGIPGPVLHPNGEQFNTGLHFPLSALFKEFLHFTKIPPVFIHPNIIRHVRAPALPSIGDGTARLYEGRGEGTRGGPGWMGGVLRASGEALLSKLLFSDSGSGKEGHIVDWVEKASIACLNKLFEDRRQGEVLQDAAYRAELDGDCPGVPRESKEADVEKRRALLDNREKKKNEGTLRKAPGQKRGAASPANKDPAKKRKLVKNGRDGPGHVTGLNHSGTSLAAVARLANLADEAASINHPGSPTPDVDAVEAICAAPMEEARAESQSQPLDDPDRLALVLVKGPPSKEASLGTQSEVRTLRAASRSSARDRS